MSSIVQLDKKFLFKEFCDALNALSNSFECSDSFDEIIAQYSSPTRFYHDLRHVQYCIQVLNENKQKTKDYHRNHLKLAIFYHDFFYDVSRKDNELRSATFAYEKLRSLGLGNVDCEYISTLILATKPNFFINDKNSDAYNLNINIIHDLDYASMGVEDYDSFVQDSENIFKETTLPRDIFIEKRCDFLKDYLQGLIFYTNIVKTSRERIAKKNIARYIKEFSSHGKNV